MTTYNPLASHAVNDALKDLLGLESDQILVARRPNLEPVHKWSLDRVFLIANETELVLSKIASKNLNLSALDGLSNSLRNAFNELNNFKNNNNAAHINNARNHVESAAAQELRKLVPLDFAPHPATETALQSYRRKFAHAKKRSASDIKQLKSSIIDLQAKLDKESEKVAQLAGAVDAKKAENEALLAELRAADQSRVESQISETKESLSEARDKLSKFLTEEEKRVSAKLENVASKSDDSLKEIDQKREEAKAIVQSVGDILTIGSYTDRASNETEKADKFRTITIALFVFGLLILVSNYLIFAVGTALGQSLALSESWQALSVRIATALAVTLPAFYTARESARHRTNADLAKQRELELATLGPFIELLPENMKAAIRDRLTDRYFGGEIDAHEVVPPISSEDISKVIVEAFKNQSGHN